MSSNQAVGLSSFNVGENYQVVDVVGEGAYGVVWYVLDPLLPDAIQIHH
jgi:hypothetical protein